MSGPKYPFCLLCILVISGKYFAEIYTGIRYRDRIHIMVGNFLRPMENMQEDDANEA